VFTPISISSLNGDHAAGPGRRSALPSSGWAIWGPNLLRVLNENPDVEIRWICDLDPDRLAKYRRGYPAAHVTTDAPRVKSDPKVHAVVVATPVHTHYEVSAEAPEAGKHVFVRRVG
jgi:predicted dehydrogenase